MSRSPTRSLSQIYRSTRGGSSEFSFEQVVLTGLAGDGGLFIPHDIPSLPDHFLSDWSDLSFQELAHKILSLYIDPAEIPSRDLKNLIDRSYSGFRAKDVAPLYPLRPHEELYLLELFHGPTYAFKDVALQLLGNLFEYFLARKNADSPIKSHITVVGATSGDTGSAAIYGLRNKKDVSVFILHPKGRISPIQEAQMTTVLDSNVHNIAVEGTFDDCQDIVKELFSDKPFNIKYHLGAVNSINWARILAQIIYYFHSYFQLVRGRDITDKKVNYIVPTGNFGDILAGYYAKKMGLPMEKLIIATNANDILDRFFKSGVYEKLPVSELHSQDDTKGLPGDDASVYTGGVQETVSPAMDILVSSNFERLLWYLADENEPRDAGEAITGWMHQLKQDGKFAVSKEVLEAAKRDFDSTRVGDAETLATIAKYYTASDGYKSYTLDPHTAVGVTAAERMQRCCSFEPVLIM
ncbi:Threonine synthase [Neolecta irregularis DAH-3]|uniref:threonine synthase n=1 Tax=Neolecta irregularis (strain DAH-3) TaxID=1198029 RepID=A0A1U7LPB9_NEOID|nr:Threonine synthase [Neolecta irregularis DAH-3]|eukprot:OLL24494.1 Threonine synthase [Neolecta irregularis DAH-3]